MKEVPLRYRKKPVVIEAVQWIGIYPGQKYPAWFDMAVGSGAALPKSDFTLSIHALEGDMIALPGDWVIRGVKGKIYPCKPDIFAATYEPAED